MRNQAHFLLPLATAAFILVIPQISAQTYFSDSFDTDTSGAWTVNNPSPTGNAATFFFDYSTIGIPSAPGSGGTTRGLKMEANHTGGVFSGLSASPTGLSLPNDYVLSFNAWQNYNGPLNGGGNGSTQMTGAGVGTAGTTPQWAGNAAYDSIFFSASGDGGTASDYRVYPVANVAGPASGFYAAGTAADAQNNSNLYYAGFGGQAAPSGQLTLFPQQTGSTAVGTQGFEWHQHVITKNGNTVMWDIDGTRIATVDASGLTLGGDNFLLNYFDINATTSTDINRRELLFGLFDNVSVTAVPEPSTVSLMAISAVVFGIAARRRAKRQ